MIDLLTGLPGNAKTLHGLELWIDRAAAENRTVYYSGLKDFKVDDPRLKGTQWVEFDPLKWHTDVPSGALVFIDEGQKIFRNRSLGSIPPLHVTELEEHRHKGLDFLIITQHPSLIDPAIRRLTQTHRHMVRIFGLEASTVHKWNGCKDNCDKARADSEKTKWAFSKSLYGLYKSADAHTMKRSIPFRAKLLLVLPFVFALCAWYVYSVVTKKQAVSSAPVVSQAQLAPGVVAGVKVFDPIADARSYVYQSTPRLVGLPQTAPKYDELTKPVRVPVPAACIQRGDIQRGEATCKCLTQQGTPMDVAFNMCIEFARNGWFQEFDADKDRAAVAKTAQSAAVIPDSPAGGVARSSGGSQVLSFSSGDVLAANAVVAAPEPSSPSPRVKR
jgi:zona occludens toxin